jgi:catechol 2,3-dioxygenase-like lactoylglutathione lyase family enzyme
MEKFYSEVLGLRPRDESRGDTWLEFDTGSTTFALHAIPPHIAGQIDITSPPEPREESPFKLILEADDLDAELARLRALGVLLIERPWGTWDGVDPEGNIFGLVPSGRKS